MIQSVVFKIKQQKHSCDKHLLFFFSHNFPDHKTRSLNVLYLLCLSFLLFFEICFNINYFDYEP